MSVRRAIDKAYHLGADVGMAFAFMVQTAFATFGLAMGGEPWWALTAFLLTVFNAWYGWRKYQAHRAGMKDLPEDHGSDVF